MANRSMLFAVSAAPRSGQRPQKILALGEFGWDIPTVFKLLVSKNACLCSSLVWEQDDLIAIAGDAKEGLARLIELRSALEDDALAAVDIDEAIAYLSKPHIEDYPVLLLEPGEILDLTDTPFPEQMDALMAEIAALDVPELTARANATAPPEDWGPGCWSSILYYQPAGSVNPPVDPLETFVMTEASHVLENAAVWSTCTEMEQVWMGGFDGEPQLLTDALGCLKAIPRPFSLNLSGSLERLPDNICELTQLTGLAIGEMGLTQLPENLSSLKQLQKLFVQCNAFAEFPEIIRDFPALKSLSIWGHPFGALPDWIGDLSKLDTLHISGCELSALPEGLWSLTQLKQLDISNTPQLTTLSPKIAKLQKLEILNVHSCGLTALPAELADLLNLREVWAADNQLRALPKKLWRKRLDTLSVAGNQLKRPWRGANAKNFWI